VIHAWKCVADDFISVTIVTCMKFRHEILRLTKWCLHSVHMVPSCPRSVT